MKQKILFLVTVLLMATVFTTGCEGKQEDGNKKFLITEERFLNSSVADDVADCMLFIQDKEGKIYSASNVTNISSLSEYRFGTIDTRLGVLGLYSSDDLGVLVRHIEEDSHVASEGDFEPVVLNRKHGDKFYSRKDNFGDLEMYPVEFVGYTFPFGDGTIRTTNPDLQEIDVNPNYYDVTVCDADGNIVSDYHILEKDTKYTVTSVFRNDGSVERSEACASCRCYKISPVVIKLPASSPAPGGGRIYDASSLDPGLYFNADAFGVIEIK